MAGPDFLGLEGLGGADAQRRNEQSNMRAEAAQTFSRQVFGQWLANASTLVSAVVIHEHFGPDGLVDTIGTQQYELMQSNWRDALTLVDRRAVSLEPQRNYFDNYLVASINNKGKQTRYFTEGGTQYRGDISASFELSDMQRMLFGYQVSAEDDSRNVNQYGWFRTKRLGEYRLQDLPGTLPLVPNDAPIGNGGKGKKPTQNMPDSFDIASSKTNAMERIFDPAHSPLVRVELDVTRAESVMGDDASAKHYVVPNPRLPLFESISQDYTGQLQKHVKRLSSLALSRFGFGEQRKIARGLVAGLEAELVCSQISTESLVDRVRQIKKQYPEYRYREIRAYCPEIVDVHAGAGQAAYDVVAPFVRQGLIPLLVGRLVESNLQNAMILNKTIGDSVEDK